MERVIGGYTILEVMLVLAMTSLLFLSAMIAIGGQSGESSFNQAMQDVNSKIQNYVSQISASSYPGSEAFSCSIVQGRAQLSTTSPGTNSDCLFIGRAFQALPGQSNINVYTVLADRDQYDSGGTDSGQLAQTIDTANPEPAINNGQYALMETYQVGVGTKIISSKVTTATTAATENDLVGIYTGLPSDVAANTRGTAALVLRGYPCTASTCPTGAPNVVGVKDCIEEKNLSASLNCSTPSTGILWTLCLSQGDGTKGNNSAALTVNSAPGGITSQLAFGKCA